MLLKESGPVARPPGHHGDDERSPDRGGEEEKSLLLDARLVALDWPEGEDLFKFPSYERLGTTFLHDNVN